MDPKLMKFLEGMIIFLERAHEEGWPQELVVEQLNLVRQGIFDVRMKDLTGVCFMSYIP